jgi:hypothetical protein
LELRQHDAPAGARPGLAGERQTVEATGLVCNCSPLTYRPLTVSTVEVLLRGTTSSPFGQVLRSGPEPVTVSTEGPTGARFQPRILPRWLMSGVLSTWATEETRRRRECVEPSVQDHDLVVVVLLRDSNATGVSTLPRAAPSLGEQRAQVVERLAADAEPLTNGISAEH